MNDAYDAERDGHDSYLFAIAALREKGVREGRFPPRDDRERRWAAEGPVPNDRLDTIRGE